MPDLILEARLVECTARRRTYRIAPWNATIDLVKGRQWEWLCWTVGRADTQGPRVAPTLDLAKRAAMARLNELAKED